MERQLHLSLGYCHFCWATLACDKKSSRPLPPKAAVRPRSGGR
jgi:hypothetical protein